jgi:hypothetical protein
MDTECGYMQGTSLDDLSRLLKQMPKSAAMYIPARTKEGKLTNGKIDNSSSARSFTGGSSGALPVRSLWVHITGGYVFLYNHIGGHVKVVLNMKHFQMRLQNQGGRRTRMILKPDGGFLPTIEFITTKTIQNFAWRLAFTCSYRKAKMPTEPFNIYAVWQDTFKLGFSFEVTQKGRGFGTQSNTTAASLNAAAGGVGGDVSGLIIADLGRDESSSEKNKKQKSRRRKIKKAKSIHDDTAARKSEERDQGQDQRHQNNNVSNISPMSNTSSGFLPPIGASKR